MRIESIEIKNFRQYREEKVLFPKKSGSKDIHIIIGENGEGKTNILKAFTCAILMIRNSNFPSRATIFNFKIQRTRIWIFFSS